MTRVEYMKKMHQDQDAYTNTIYRFIGEQMEKDPRYQTYLKKCYDEDERDLDEEEQIPDFDSWFKTTYFNPEKDCFKEGVEDWLGQMQHMKILDQWLTDIDLKGFVGNLIKDEGFELHLNYSTGQNPGDVYSMMFNPRVYIHLDLTERFEYLKDIKNWI